MLGSNCNEVFVSSPNNRSGANVTCVGIPHIQARASAEARRRLDSNNPTARAVRIYRRGRPFGEGRPAVAVCVPGETCVALRLVSKDGAKLGQGSDGCVAAG